MKRSLIALLLAGFAGISYAAPADGDPYRSSAGSSESDNVVINYGG